MSTYNQGNPSVSQVISASNVYLIGNTASGNALSVQQLGAGNVASFRTTTGATALFVAGSGNVGVGTGNPSQTLHVYTNAAGNPTSTGTGADSNAAVRVQMQTVGLDIGTTIAGATWFQNRVPGSALATGYPISLNPLGGNVGIGTTNPSCKFNVDNGTGTGLNSFIQASGITAGGTTGFLLGKALSTNNCATMNWNHVGDGLGTNYLGIGAYANDSKLNITAAGNVGIGTTNPASQLHVYSSSTSSLSSPFTGLTIMNINGGGGSGSVSIDLTTYNTVGYNPAARIAALDNNYGADIIFSSKTQGGPANAMRENMRILANGNVGIGTTNPGYALQVNGSIGMVGGTSIPLTLPATGSQTSYSITLAASGTWYTVISDARINATITGAIGQSDLTSTIFIATLIATGGASASMTLVTGNAANIRVSGTALQFLANGSSYGLICGFTLIRHN